MTIQTLPFKDKKVESISILRLTAAKILKQFS